MDVVDQEYEAEVAVGKLKPHPQNANVGAKGKIAESIDRSGFYGACIAQRSTGQILIGNHRWEVAIEKGAQTIPVIWVDVDDDQALRIMAVDNRTGRLGYDDDVRLVELLSAFGDDLGGTGYDGDDLNALITKLAGEAAPPSEFREYGEGLDTEHVCPRCGYAFSGTAKKRAPLDGD